MNQEEKKGERTMADEMIVHEISQEIEDLDKLLNPQSDLISRENMIGELRQMYNEARKWYDEAPTLSEAKARAEACMETLVDIKLRAEKMPAERKSGHWITKEKVRGEWSADNDYRYECSECGMSDVHNKDTEVPFCWHCGARMERE